MRKYEKKAGSKYNLPFTLKDLLAECAAKGLKVRKCPSANSLRREASLLLVAYSRKCTELGKAKLEAEDVTGDSLESMLLSDFGTVDEEQPPQACVPLSCMLPLLYFAAYYSTRNDAVLVSDVLCWARDLRIRYMTGYKALELPRNYVSLFKPTRVPGEEWLRREISSLKQRFDLATDFPELEPRVMFTRVRKELFLPEKLTRLGEVVLQRYEGDLRRYRTQRSLEVRALAAQFIALKLVYGLNGIPYSILTERTREHTAALAQSQSDELALFHCDLPPLSYLAKVSVMQQWKEKFDSRTTVPWDFDDLSTLCVQQEGEYLSRLLASGMLQETASQDLKSLYAFLRQHKQPACTAPSTPGAQVQEFVPAKRENPELVAELDHLKDEKAEIPLPCMDWITFKKKAANRVYPGEYVLTLCAFAQLVGRQKLSELHELVDRMERLVAKDEANSREEAVGGATKDTQE